MQALRRVLAPVRQPRLYKYCSPANPFAFGFAGIQVDYRRCQDCGFIFTDFFDDWTTDEFAAYVYNADYPRIDSEYAEIRPGNRAVVHHIQAHAIGADSPSAKLVGGISGCRCDQPQGDRAN